MRDRFKARLKHRTGNTSDIFSHYLNDINRFELLTRRQETALSKKIKKGNKAAFDHMANANLRLVVNIAKKYASFGHPLEELVASGNVGLVKAIGKFDHTRKLKFSTYATWWIAQTIRQYLSDCTRTIRIPAYKLWGDDAAAIKGRTSVAPLDKDESELFISNSDTVREVSDKEELTIMMSYVNSLEDRKQHVIKGRYGIGCEPKTLRVLADEMELSRERVRQLEKEALAELKDCYLLASSLA